MGYFLTREDFNWIITLEDLDRLTASTDSVWQNALASKIEVMSSYMRFRYDVSEIFSSVEDWDILLSWPIGARVISGGAHYVSAQAVPVSTLITDLNYWTPRDSRNQELVEIASYLTLHKISGRPNSIGVNEDLLNRFNYSMKSLELIRDGVKDMDIPLLPATEDGTDLTGDGFIPVSAEEAINRTYTI